MDVCVENVFPAVAAPFNSFHEDTRERKNQEADASRVRAIPNIVHVALDEFFASVEQVLNPQLQRKPVIVGREAVASASHEAKLCGVETGMPIGQALRISPKAIVVPGQYGQYADFAERVRRILETFTAAVEPGALDDFYLDFGTAKQMYSGYEAILRRVQAQVLEETGLTVSIGAARTKAVASMASRREQPRGFRMIAPGTEADFLARLPVDAMRGVGLIDAASLTTRGIATLGELRKVPRAALERAFGEVSGQQIWERARGIDGRQPRTFAPRRSSAPPKTVSHETLSREITMEGGRTDSEFLSELLGYLCQRISYALRERTQQARTIGLRIRYVDEFAAQQTARLTRPSSSERALFAEAKELFAELFTRRVALETVRVSVMNFEVEHRRDALCGSDLGKLGAQHAAPLQRAAC